MKQNISLSIKGLQKAQQANVRWIAAMEPSGARGKYIRDFVAMLQRYLISVTHVDTGSYRASQRGIVLLDNDPRGVLTPDPTAVNSRSGRSVIEYALVEEARGESHAAYERTYEYGKVLMPRMARRSFHGKLTKK